MSDRQALLLVAEGVQPDQDTIKRLLRLGWINVDNGTNFDSEGQELFVMSITEQGYRKLRTALSYIQDRLSEMKKQTPLNQQKIANLIAGGARIERALSR